jgi:hypothetical protein
LDASTKAQHDGDRYEILGTSNPQVRLFHAGSVLPEKVSVEIRGRFRPHLVAYWDGCATFFCPLHSVKLFVERFGQHRSRASRIRILGRVPLSVA